MSSAIETTVKALVEFESELDKAKASALEAKRRTSKDATNWAEEAKTSAVSKAREIASMKITQAREDAEAEAEKIRQKGEADMRTFEASISKHRAKAAELVASRLLGGND